MLIVNNPNSRFTRSGRDGGLRRGISTCYKASRVAPILGAKRLTVNDTARATRSGTRGVDSSQDLARSFAQGQVLFVNFCNHDVIRVNHFSQVNGGDFREQFVGVQLGQPVILMNPTNELRKRDA